MVKLYRWKIVWLPLLLMVAALYLWPGGYIGAAESVKLNALDRMSENFSKVTYVDDDDWATTDCHLLIGGLYGSNTITSGDVGPIQVDANGNVITTAAPAVEKTPVLIVKANATPSTALPLVASETFVRAFYLQAKKVAGDNTGNVFVGLSALDQGVAEQFELTPGATFEITMPAGTKLDLNDVYIDADTAADGVIGWYIPI